MSKKTSRILTLISTIMVIALIAILLSVIFQKPKTFIELIEGTEIDCPQKNLQKSFDCFYQEEHYSVSRYDNQTEWDQDAETRNQLCQNGVFGSEKPILASSDKSFTIYLFEGDGQIIKDTLNQAGGDVDYIKYCEI